MPEETRAWWKEAVIYQIYPRSFQDSNGDGIGDLNGIRQRLPYLKKLGVDVLWLSPIYQSPNDDNGYDISDYRAIMDEFGTMADFDNLLAETHALGMKLVMDLVVNHTSDEHAWFIESSKSKDNPYRDFYIWKDGKDGQAPNNWESWFSGSAWQYDARTKQYYLHCFSRKQPDLNWENEKVRDAVYDMMEWWCQKGIDGFRMDVVSMYSKMQTFPDGALKEDGYGDMTPYVCNGPRIHEFLQEMRRRVLAKHDLLTVGETACVTTEEAKKYANLDGSELNMVFQFDHVGPENGEGSILGKWTTGKPQMPKFRAIMNRWQRALDGKAWNSLYYDNHDQPRAVSRFGDDSPEWRVLSAKMLAICLHLQKGTPYIYQGEEIGITNMKFHSLADCRDLEEINAWKQAVEEKRQIDGKTLLACFDHIARDNARTPMQWENAKNGGFSTGTPWIAVNPNYTTINAEAALQDKDSIFYTYQKLIQLRHEHDVIVYGTFEPLLEDDAKVYAYARELDGKRLIVACNWTKETVPCTLFAEQDTQGEELISNYKSHEKCKLQPFEARAILYRV